MSPSKHIAQYLLRIAFVQSAMQDEANFTLLKSRPSNRVLTGIGLILISYTIGWPAISLLGLISYRTGKVSVLVIGGPLMYGISHLVFMIGTYLAGKHYAVIFLRCASRLAVEKLTSSREGR